MRRAWREKVRILLRGAAKIMIGGGSYNRDPAAPFLKWIAFTLGLFVTSVSCLALAASAQILGESPLTKGSSELQLSVAGSKDISQPGSFIPGVPGITGWGLGLRYGRMVSDWHGRGLLRGQAEFTSDLEPVALFYLHHNANYVFGVRPFGIEWNLRERRGFQPFGGIAVGMLFANHNFPPGTEKFNFTANGGLGLRWRRVRGSPLLGVDFFHVSNASLGPSNPSINFVRFRVGFNLGAWPK
jgi:hypothetical protein